MRRRSTVVVGLSLGAAVLLGEPADLVAGSRHGHDGPWCWTVRAEMSATFVAEGCDSVVGMCTAGTVQGPLLSGDTWFSATGLGGGVMGEPSIVTPPAEPPSTWAYAGTLVIDTALGSLTLSDVGVFDTYGGGFSEVDRVVDGSGFYAGAEGTLFIYGVGYEDGTGFDSSIRGHLCVQPEWPHG